MNNRSANLIKNRGICPCPHKKCFVTKQDAKNHRDKNHKSTHSADDLSIYHCVCGAYHYTSMSKEKSRSPHTKHGKRKIENETAFKELLKKKK